jgi:hypothetical protein
VKPTRCHPAYAYPLSVRAGLIRIVVETRASWLAITATRQSRGLRADWNAHGLSRKRIKGPLRPRAAAVSCLWAGVIALLVAAAPTAAVTPALLIGPGLDVQSVNVTGLRDGTLHYFDPQRTLLSAEVGGLVQLRSIGGEDIDGSTPGAALWLTDGQRFTGEWVGPTPDGLGLRWRHPLIGAVTVPLEEVARVIWLDGEGVASTGSADTPTTDTVTLINGDVMNGFVSELTGQGVTLVPDAGGEPVTVPYKRIASMTLANPTVPADGPYHLVTLTDGTRVFADAVELTGERASWRVTPPGAPGRQVDAPIEALARIDFRAGGLRLIDLADLPRRTVRGSEVFGLPLPIRAVGRSLRMHAPAEVRFELPDGAVRFAAVAELDTTGDAPADMASWSDFHVVVSVQGEEAGRCHVSGDGPVARLNTPVSGPTMTLRLEPGVNGPILDRLLLRDAVVLIRIPGSESTGHIGR